MHTLNGVEPGNNSLTPPVKRGMHDRNLILRAGQCRQRRTLGDIVHVRAQMRLQVRGGRDNILRANHPAHTPPRHGVRFRHTIEDDAVRGELRNYLENRDRINTVVGEVLIDFVGEHKNPLRERPLPDSACLFLGVDRTGWV